MTTIPWLLFGFSVDYLRHTPRVPVDSVWSALVVSYLNRSSLFHVQSVFLWGAIRLIVRTYTLVRLFHIPHERQFSKLDSQRHISPRALNTIFNAHGLAAYHLYRLAQIGTDDKRKGTGCWSQILVAEARSWLLSPDLQTDGWTNSLIVMQGYICKVTVRQILVLRSIKNKAKYTGTKEKRKN